MTTVDPHRCACVRLHHPLPEEYDRHHVWPQGWGGPTVRSNLVTLCPTTHHNVHRILRQYAHLKGKPDYAFLRHYNAYARALAAEGWRRFSARNPAPTPTELAQLVAASAQR